MAKKKPKLLDDIKSLPPVQSKKPNWWESIRLERPDDFNAIIEVVDDYWRGGPTKEVFPSLSSLHRYLSGQDGQRPRKPLFHVGQTTFVQFARKVRDGQVQAADSTG